MRIFPDMPSARQYMRQELGLTAVVFDVGTISIRVWVDPSGVDPRIFLLLPADNMYVVTYGAAALQIFLENANTNPSPAETLVLRRISSLLSC